MRVINRVLDWTNQNMWAWPDNDTKLLDVFYQVNDIKEIVKYVPKDKRNVCVQAGGACGLWPFYYSKLFSKVYTFEPEPTNFACLLENTVSASNIVSKNIGLSDSEKLVDIVYEPSKIDNRGSGFLVQSTNGTSKTETLDSQNIEECNLIQLDVEGEELNVLKGAVNLISSNKPVICLEVKILPHMTREGRSEFEAINWLHTNFNYRPVGQIHRDVILSCQ
jgi:FkbM family methyltransferase